MCGSEIVSAIKALEEKELSNPSRKEQARASKKSESSRICTHPVQWRALVIGVSVRPDCDAKVLREAGADLVWGKPIPRVGDALRNQLLNSLVAKRRQASRTALDNTTNKRVDQDMK